MPENVEMLVPVSETLDQFPRTLNVIGSGRITILDAKSFYIPNFFLNIMEPGYHFWAGKSLSGMPDKQGQMVADDKARFDQVKFYGGDDVIITLPGDLNAFDVNYLAIFNPDLSDNIANVAFNVTGLRIPPALGQTKKPGWWFDVPLAPPPPSKTPPTGDDHVPFEEDQEPPNCRELLGRKIRLMWRNQGETLYFRVKVHMEPGQFAAIAFAAEGSPNIDADAVKIFYNETENRYSVEDAFLSKRVFCDFSDGLCADASRASGQHVRYMGGMKTHGLAIIDFQRPFTPGDMHDAPIAMNGPTQVIVAIGSFSQTRNLELENTTVDFGMTSSTSSTCPDLNSLSKFADPDPARAWKVSSFLATADDILVARLGPTGGAKGYGAITGANPPFERSSVVWWINDRLLPEIYVERGKTYYFRVQGGDNPSREESYHPLYVTDNPEGGYIRKTPNERRVETIYAGISDQGGTVTPTGVGPLCEYVTPDGADRAPESETFSDYRSSLQLACEPGREGQYGWVNWTVQMDTPSLLYYQSFNGFGLGWKIHVINEGDPASKASKVSLSAYVVILVLFFQL